MPDVWGGDGMNVLMPAVVAYVAGKGGSKADAQSMWNALQNQYFSPSIVGIWDQMEQAWKNTPTGSGGPPMVTWGAIK